MTEQSPFEGESAGNDNELVAQIRGGSRDALETLIRRHQSWIYNIVQRMVYVHEDAEDITQEILIKIITKLATFEGRSSFRTWLYRIVVNHVLNMNRARAERREWTFELYEASLDAFPDAELPDPRSVPADVELLVDEARISCTSGMLLCLTREQRLTYILGEIFGVTDNVGAEILEISRENFRQKLARARRDLHHFMQNKCGLINKANPCRCARKTRAFMTAGYVNPDNLLFARGHISRVREVARKTCDNIDSLDAAYAEIHRDHPFLESPDFAASLRNLMDLPDFKSILDFH